ncbi:hypothetical protein C8R43DRAFT_1007669 [Mycena crocata]|nr:hypothetical protein C8R43DRAFT_1007669 [Mycena crocata]
MSFTESVALALFDWHCAPFSNPPTKQTMHIHGSLTLHGRSSIDRLPNELLSTIFISAIEQHCHDESNPFTTSPTTISHICRRWRQVALSTGSLWTNIVLTFPTSNEQLTRTLTWLGRSKTYPLDILMDFRDQEWDWEEDTHGFRWEDMEAVLRLLLPFSPRWRTIELFTDTWAPIFAFLLRTRAVGSSLNCLEKLHLARCNEYFATKDEIFEPTALSQHLPLFGGSEALVPRLREVSLSGVHIDWSAPLGNLTKLELKYHAANVMPSVTQFAQILTACPDLEVLTIVGCGPKLPAAVTAAPADGLTSSAAHGGSPARPTLKLTRVTQLTFGFVDVNDAMYLLSILDLPALRALNIEDVSVSLSRYMYPEPECSSSLLNWLAGISGLNFTSNALAASPMCASASASPIPLAQLDTLTLQSVHAPSAAFARFFTACVGLRELRLRQVGGGALDALGEVDISTLPHLCSLSARGGDKEVFMRIAHEHHAQLTEVFFEDEVSDEVLNINDDDS